MLNSFSFLFSLSFLTDLTIKSERERQANIEANRVLLQQLNLDEGPSSLGFVAINPPKGSKSKPKAKDPSAKPVKPRKSAGTKRKAESDSEEVVVRRISTRRRRGGPVDPDETPEQKIKREVNIPFALNTLGR